MLKTIGFILITSLSFAQSITKTMNLLPDTGQNLSYTTIYGEDNDYNINVPSYTNNGNGTITDNITGLMWQQVDGGEMTIENATTYCDNLVLGGFSDWRLPSPKESFSILNHQNNNPAMSTTFFTASLAEYWWTNTYQAGDNTKVWCTNAGGGIGNHPKSETISAGGIKKFHVRAVRNSSIPTIIPNHFTDNGNGTITDNLTQLVWQKAPNTAVLTWENALAYAENLSLASAIDWRLPNIKELQSLNDESVTNPSANTTFFPTIGVHNYWSSTSLPNQTTKSWYWNTQFGITTYDTKTNTNYVICVKGNPTTLTINENNLNKNQIIIYPNPATNEFNLDIDPLIQDQVHTIMIYDVLGELVFSCHNYLKTISCANFSSGMYIIKISVSEFEVSKKLVIQ